MVTTIVVGILSLCALVYVAAAVFVYVRQRSLIYHPTQYVSVEGLVEENVVTPESRHKLKTYTANRGQRHALLYFGGNAEAIAPRIKELAEQLPQITIIGFDYRGYGGSEGQPSESAFYEDVLQQYDRIAQGYERVSALGRSLGSALALYLATQRKLEKLVLVTPFDSLLSIASARYWCFPIRWLLKDKFDSASRAAGVTAPTLVLIAESDSIVPEQNTDCLMATLINCSCTRIRIDGTGHNTIADSPLYGHHISEFIEKPRTSERHAEVKCAAE